MRSTPLTEMQDLRFFDISYSSTFLLLYQKKTVKKTGCFFDSKTPKNRL